MSGRILTRAYEAPPIDRREILRYMGARESSTETEELIDRTVALAEGRLRYRVCYVEADVRREDGGISLDGLYLPFQTVCKALRDCDRAVLFAATVGLELDRLIRTYTRTSPAVALCLQAYGAERVEALCDRFCREYAEENGACRPRISPGYGDFPLETQRELFRLLDCPRKIGLSLNESLLMTPSKSVTAVFGRKENHEHS